MESACFLTDGCFLSQLPPNDEKKHDYEGREMCAGTHMLHMCSWALYDFSRSFCPLSPPFFGEGVYSFARVRLYWCMYPVLAPKILVEK